MYYNISLGGYLMEQYTQGSVFWGLRSQYYKEKKCYGIVITARCEIAQQKAKVIHVLSALSLEDWVVEELFPRAAHEYLHNDVLGPIYEWAKNNELDIETLLEFGPAKVMVNLDSDIGLQQRKRDQLKAALKKWEEWNTDIVNCSRNTKLMLLNTKLSKKKVALLKELMMGHFPNEFCFLPQCAQFEEGSKVQGMVVKLKDIIPLSPKDLEEIQAKGFDYSEILRGPCGRQRLELLNGQYWLSNEDDFVIMDKPICSPWIEYLMQNFANSFVRIGVDGASSVEILNFCKSYAIS